LCGRPAASINSTCDRHASIDGENGILRSRRVA
jgi:hypothetical protein